MKPKLRLRSQTHYPVKWRGSVLSLKFIRRFWSRVTKTETCWLWTHTKDKDGYGVVSVNYGKTRTHRISFILAFGNIPDEKCVLHKCDVRNCVNPNHLYAGDRKSNAEDRQERNPQIGESHGRAKFDEKQVIKIRRLAAIGLTPATIAKGFNTSHQNIRHIVNKKSWAHI